MLYDLNSYTVTAFTIFSLHRDLYDKSHLRGGGVKYYWECRSLITIIIVALLQMVQLGMSDMPSAMPYSYEEYQISGQEWSTYVMGSIYMKGFFELFAVWKKSRKGKKVIKNVKQEVK